jgi:hypothetical protein
LIIADHLVIGLVGAFGLAVFGFGAGLGAVENGEIVDAVAAHDVALLARRQPVVERERALEQFLGVGKHVLVEIDAAEVVQRLRQLEVGPAAGAFEDRDRCLQRVFRVRKPPGVAVEIAEL